MAKATPEQTRKANRAAAVVAVCVAIFAVCFMYLVTMLNGFATQLQQEEVVIAPEAPTEPFYVLLIGSDTRKGTALYTGKPTEHAQVDQHSDVMTLMRVDPQEYTISLLTIPRDTVVTKSSEKINCALLGNNPEDVVDAVRELTSLKADYYMMTTFGTFADLIDALGGVTMDVPVTVEASDPTTGGSIRVEAGKAQHLNGAQALALARARTEFSDNQDAVRQLNVRQLEQAIVERMLEGDSLGIEALLVVLEGDVQTDMDLGVLGQAVLDFIDHADKVKIYSGTGPYTGEIRQDDEQWVIPNDRATWHSIMKEFTDGEKDFVDVVPQPKPPTPPKAKDNSSSSASGKSGKSSTSSSKASSDKSDASSSSADANRLNASKS